MIPRGRQGILSEAPSACLEPQQGAFWAELRAADVQSDKQAWGLQVPPKAGGTVG